MGLSTSPVVMSPWHNGINNSQSDFIGETFHHRAHSELVRDQKLIEGTLVMDIDGTITEGGSKRAEEGNKYKINEDAIRALSRFSLGGGRIIFNTGATLGRTERTVLTPLLHDLQREAGRVKDTDFLPRIFVMPENGSALLIFKRLVIVENEVRFDWHRLHALEVPKKDVLRAFLEKEFLPKFPGAVVWGDHPGDQAPRDYILSMTRLKEGSPRELLPMLLDAIKKHPELRNEPIQLKAARTTVDFVHADSGKTISVSWVLKEIDDFQGPVIGMGDLGDEFAAVIPTFSVNKFKPNEFRRRGMPAMDLGPAWQPLERGSFAILGKGGSAVVRAVADGREIQVLRDSAGEIIFSRPTARTQQATNKFYEPCSACEGSPLEIRPLSILDSQGQRSELPDAGGASAWLINRLIDVGYFASATLPAR